MWADRLTVLAYHRIGAPADGAPGMVSATPQAFERQMRRLASSGRAVSLDRVLATHAGAGPLARGAVLVTFDDAYADFAEHAWPALSRHGIPVTLFVPTAFPGNAGAAFWWERLHAAVRAGREPIATPLGSLRLDSAARRRSAYRALRDHVKGLPHDEGMALVDELAAAVGAPAPRARVLNWDELRALAAAGVTLAPHTRTHPCLDRLPPERLAAEIGGSLAELEAETGTAARVFAYPAGHVSAAAETAVREAGFELAFTTRSCVADLGDGAPLRLPRLCVSPRRPPVLLRAAAALPRRSVPAHPPGRPDERPAVAYVMSRFPKLSETFILTEIFALERRGVRVEVYPLLRGRSPLVHPGAGALAARAHYLPFLSAAVLGSQLHWLRRRPREYLRALRDVALGTLGSLNFFAGGLAIFPKVAHAARLMETGGVDHVHCHFANHPALAGLVISRLTGLPFSFTAHGSDLHVERRMLAAKVSEAAFVATVSHYNRRLIVEECGGRFADKVRVIRAGVDTAMFAPHPNGKPPDALRLLCVGTLHEVKGQAHLVEACRLLAQQGVDFTCRLVGDGPDRRRLAHRIAAAGLRDRVLLVGPRTRLEVAAELGSADVVVAPSVRTRAGKREGVPVALIEAMSSGVPVVASDLSGIPELVEHGVNGLLAVPGDAASLAEALRTLHEDRALGPRLARAARARVLAEFDAEQSVAELVRGFGVECTR